MARAFVRSDRSTHILDGDRTGGGHRGGTGSPSKSKFLAQWSDVTIIHAIESVATDPAYVWTRQPNGRFRNDGVRDGVRIRVIVNTDRVTIWTAYPI